MAPLRFSPGEARASIAIAGLVFASAFLVGPSDAAKATFPGRNGKIVFSRRVVDGNFEIFSMNPDGSGQTNLTQNPASDNDPAGSPDGRRIAFSRYAGGNADIFVMNADGSGQK